MKDGSVMTTFSEEPRWFPGSVRDVSRAYLPQACVVGVFTRGSLSVHAASWDRETWQKLGLKELGQSATAVFWTRRDSRIRLLHSVNSPPNTSFHVGESPRLAVNIVDVAIFI